jgi:hypothetical protein
VTRKRQTYLRQCQLEAVRARLAEVPLVIRTARYGRLRIEKSALGGGRFAITRGRNTRHLDEDELLAYLRRFLRGGLLVSPREQR